MILTVSSGTLFFDPGKILLSPVPIIGFVGPSGSGKTTLITKVIPLLRQKGLHIAAIKQSHHDIEIDKPGKDSYVLRQAGAEQTIIASKHRWALITETPGRATSPAIDYLINQLDLDYIDIIIVEGFKGHSFPKIEVFRGTNHETHLFKTDKDIIAIATDDTIQDSVDIPVLDMNNPTTISKYILEAVLQIPQ